MAPKHHGKSMSQPERAFWRDAFVSANQAFLTRRGTMRSPVKAAALAADYADAAVEEFRRRITWRNP
jgi:hypothetical protein